MGWPQIIYLALLLYGVIDEATHHGETKTGRRNGWATLISACISSGLAYWGGFFN